MTARQYEREGGLTRFSLDRRITVLVLLLTTLVVGAMATLRVPVELIPSGFDAPHLMITVPWPDAPSREVLDKLGLVLEEELSTVRGIADMWTVSQTGRCRVFLDFKHGTDMDIAYREVRDRIERARSRFPDDIDQVFVRKEDSSGIPLFVLGLAIDPTLSDSYNLIQNEVILPLSRIDGVASVQADGLEEKEILIELDREKTAASGLNIYELAQRLGSDNFTMASGTVREGPDKLQLRSISRFESIEELSGLLVGPTTRLGDVATISYDEPKKEYRARAMSRPAVAVIVYKEGEANVSRVAHDVARTVERLKANPRLQSMQTVTLFSQGDVIEEALTTLLNSGLVGGLLAAFVLFFFMRRARLTLIIAGCIPLSMLIGLTVMYFGGETLNLLTLLGLMICVGLLVDNSVVVAENIHRLHREGAERREACISGAGEVALAITMSTLTTLVVFLPVALIDGPGQFFLLRLAMPVCVSVAGSLLVALVFIPLCVYLTLPARRSDERTWLKRSHERLNGRLRSAYEATFGRLNTAYGRLLAAALARRFDMVLVLLIVFGLTAWLAMQKVKFVESQEEERNGFFVGVEMPQATTLEEAEEWFLAAEKTVEGMQKELGLEGWFLMHRKTHGNIQGWFTRPRSTDLTPSEVTQRVIEAFPTKPGIKLSTGRDEETDECSGESVYCVAINGEDTEQLEQVAEALEEALVRVDGVLGLKGNSEPQTREVGLVIDRERAQRYGVNPQAVAGVVGYALRGAPLPRFHDAGREVPVRVRFREADRESLTELADFTVPSASGEMLALSTLTDAHFLPTPEWIVRHNKRTGRQIKLELVEGREDETRERLGLILARSDLPEGISFRGDARRGGFNEDLAGMLFALLLSITFIYLLMGFLFESFILPLSILLTIPLSIIGVYWIHLFTGRNIDFLGVVAIILLVGVVVNNGIVLIDYVNRLRQQGQDRHSAVIAAADRRFRPIMMTAITTIGGMIPLAFAGANSIGLSYTSFSLTLIGGMTTATLLTLLVVPVFYTFFDDSREVLGGWARLALGRRPGRVRQVDSGDSLASTP